MVFYKRMWTILVNKLSFVNTFPSSLLMSYREVFLERLFPFSTEYSGLDCIIKGELLNDFE